jgi:hypothetical protein
MKVSINAKFIGEFYAIIEGVIPQLLRLLETGSLKAGVRARTLYTLSILAENCESIYMILQY